MPLNSNVPPHQCATVVYGGGAAPPSASGTHGHSGRETGGTASGTVPPPIAYSASVSARPNDAKRPLSAATQSDAAPPRLRRRPAGDVSLSSTSSPSSQMTRQPSALSAKAQWR